MQLSAEEQAFVQQHLTADVGALLLRSPAGALNVKKLAAQIAARQKARHKLPTWYAHPALVFPPALSVEQASSERTARYKAELVREATRLIDLTGGMGVDAWAFAHVVAHVTYVERDADLAARAAHNFAQLGLRNVGVVPADGLHYVRNVVERADWLYLDPARRDERGGRVVHLADCEPNVADAAQLAPLLAKTNSILLKTSPLIDIDATLRALQTVRAVHVVAAGGEVREVLFVLGQVATPPDDVMITAANLTDDTGGALLTFRRGDERSAAPTLSDPLRYVYEPHAAVLKAGAFRTVGTRYGLAKLAPNSHLYTSTTWVADFPGRAFELLHVVKPDRRALLAVLPGGQANLTVRNFPQSVADLRKKLALRDGGDHYVLATQLRTGEHRLLVTRKATRSLT